MLSLILPSGGSGGGSSAWGGITGTLSAQTDLQAALDAKLAKAGGTMTGQLVNSTNGAASTPSLLLSGTPFTGGSATTTKPLVNIETAGATSTGWSTSGTMLGVNAPSGFAGNLADWQVNGTPRFKVDKDGIVYANGAYTTQPGVNAVLSGQGSFTLLGYSSLWKVYLNNNEFGPWVDGEVSLGTASKGWKDAVINGACDAGSFKVGGVAGASFSGVATNITVVNGIITAIS